MAQTGTQKKTVVVIGATGLQVNLHHRLEQYWTPLTLHRAVLSFESLPNHLTGTPFVV
jgi:hypothetical protein